MNSLTDTFKLSNGVDIPCVGFGTWQLKDGDNTYNAVINALELGYVHIDTAAIYGNEPSIGRAIRDTGIPRENLFITSKLWNENRGYDKTLAAFNETLKRLGMDYLDLYLIHWPATESKSENWQEINADTWRAIEKLYHDKKIRAIGVSNFMTHHLEPLMARAEVKPMVNQIEYNPGTRQPEAVSYCRAKGILVESWGPLGQGRVLNNPDLKQIASYYGKSVSQICLRWCLQNGVLPLPKSEAPIHIAENAEIFDFTISDTDMEAINTMPEFGGSGMDPDSVPF